MTDTDDLRVRRTRKAIQTALMELTVEKGFAAVTISDICERAMINRSTFYRHFLDKYQLLDLYLDEVAAITSEQDFVAEKTEQRPANRLSGLVSLLRHIQKFGAFYSVMLGANGDAYFIQGFRKMSEDRFRFLLTMQPPDPNAPPVELRLNYISCAGIGAITWWLESGQNWTPEEIAAWISQMSTASVGLPRHT